MRNPALRGCAAMSARTRNEDRAVTGVEPRRVTHVAAPPRRDAAPQLRDAAPPLRDRLTALWPQASLRVYLAAIMLLATVPFVVLMGFRIHGDFVAQRTRMWSELDRTAVATAQNVERELAASIETLSIIGRTTLAGHTDSADFEALLRDHPRPRHSWQGTFLLAADGQVLVDAAFPLGEGRALGVDAVRNLPEYKTMLMQPRPLVSNLIARGAGQYGTAVLVPVLSRGRVAYVVGAWIDFGAWQALLKSSAPPADGFFTLYDRNRTVVARTLAPEQSVGKQLPAGTVAPMRSLSAGAGRLESLEGHIQYGAWHSVPASGWGVAVAIPAAPLDAAVLRSGLTAAAVAALCVLLGLYLAS